MEREAIVAIGLLTQTQVNMLGSALRQVFPLTHDGRFDDLLEALDRERGRSAAPVGAEDAGCAPER